ncbi:MAG: lytic transglycosylase domain-containing protein [Nocardioides sp.]|uniref:aggregation-promoting factor C-terminal-like domain-containing protein n=1 Tax=Nocardioides sp. TaxID=35761 RepID=UPI0039E6B6E2
MSDHAAYAPKHRAAPQRPLIEAPKKVVKTTLLLSTLAVVGTGAAVAGGVVLYQPTSSATDLVGAAQSGDQTGTSVESNSGATTTPDSDLLAARAEALSRSASRTGVQRTTADRRTTETSRKRQALTGVSSDDSAAVTGTEDLGESGDPKTIASALLSQYGWASSQFSCLDSLWTRESNWRVNASNSSSGAYGIPQALPGSKMASAGSDWQTNAATQIKWGLGYIQDRYGSPCGAWAHSESSGWY